MRCPVRTALGASDLKMVLLYEGVPPTEPVRIYPRGGAPGSRAGFPSVPAWDVRGSPRLNVREALGLAVRRRGASVTFSPPLVPPIALGSVPG